MRLRELAERPLRVLVLACDKDEDPIEAVTAALNEHGVHAAAVTGVGALRSARLGYFDPQQRDYLPIDATEQAEVVSLLGDVAEVDGRAALHLHAVLAGPGRVHTSIGRPPGRTAAPSGGAARSR